MNKVMVRVGAPDISCVRRGETVPATDMEYCAAFHVVATNKKRPVHQGPALEIRIEDDDGNVVLSDLRSIMVVDRGNGVLEPMLHKLTPSTASAETMALKKDEEEN
ncbi:MAG TPA: hypothetical protein ENH11_01150 [Candidatus Acetothermia bacterium]|nr:hypothetical protein [Candidatus Acetothermia bacterium]